MSSRHIHTQKHYEQHKCSKYYAPGDVPSRNAQNARLRCHLLATTLLSVWVTWIVLLVRSHQISLQSQSSLEHSESECDDPKEPIDRCLSTQILLNESAATFQGAPERSKTPNKIWIKSPTTTFTVLAGDWKTMVKTVWSFRNGPHSTRGSTASVAYRSSSSYMAQILYSPWAFALIKFTGMLQIYSHLGWHALTEPIVECNFLPLIAKHHAKISRHVYRKDACL